MILMCMDHVYFLYFLYFFFCSYCLDRPTHLNGRFDLISVAFDTPHSAPPV